jgi:hypothetical protein
VSQGAPAGTHTGNPVIYTTGQAGYVTTGASFRFVSTAFRVPSKYYSGGYAEVVLGGHHVMPATLGTLAGGGWGSVVWNVEGPNRCPDGRRRDEHRAQGR